MKHLSYLLFLLLLFYAPLVGAQNIEPADSLSLTESDSTQEVVVPRANIFRDMPYVKIHQDKYVERYIRTRLLHSPMQAKAQEGFRVQVMNDNDPQVGRARAEQLQATLRSAIAEPVYIVFNAPFWKVRIGDFKTIDEAKEYKTRLVSLFPNLKAETYIVKDRIKVLL